MAANENIPQSLSQIPFIGKIFGSLMKGLNLTSIYNRVVESHYDPKVIFQEYLPYFVAVVAVAALPASAGWLTVLGVSLAAGAIAKGLSGPIAAGFDAAGHRFKRDGVLGY